MEKEHRDAPGAAETRNASTVILVRQGVNGLQVYLLQRSVKSDFMPGNYVFPGGMVDPQDSDPEVLNHHLDLGWEEAIRRLGNGLPKTVALAHAVAAVRETFEETGVFLGRGGEGFEERLRAARSVRRGATRPKGWFRDLVVAEGCVLEISRLTRWAHWVTPKVIRKRFDTRFFLALHPEGQECSPDLQETIDGTWLTPREALERNHRGELSLSPPTLVNLHDLLPYGDLNSVRREMAGRPWGQVRMPRPVRVPEGAVILLPWDPAYQSEIPPEGFDQVPEILPPGTFFSRVWLNEGTWRPAR